MWNIPSPIYPPILASKGTQPKTQTCRWKPKRGITKKNLPVLHYYVWSNDRNSTRKSGVEIENEKKS